MPFMSELLASKRSKQFTELSAKTGAEWAEAFKALPAGLTSLYLSSPATGGEREAAKTSKVVFKSSRGQ